MTMTYHESHELSQRKLGRRGRVDAPLPGVFAVVGDGDKHQRHGRLPPLLLRVGGGLVEELLN